MRSQTTEEILLKTLSPSALNIIVKHISESKLKNSKPYLLSVSQTEKLSLKIAYVFQKLSSSERVLAADTVAAISWRKFCWRMISRPA